MATTDPTKLATSTSPDTTKIADAGTAKEITKEAETIAKPGEAPETDIVTPTPTVPRTAPEKRPVKPTAKTYAPAEEQFKDLIDQARKSGFDENALADGINNYNKGYLNQDQFQKWLNKFIKPKDAVTEAVDKTVGDTTLTDTETPVTTTAVEAAEQGVKDAQSEYEQTMANLSDTYKESQDTLVTSATERYNAETKNLNDALALQQQLAAQQQALIASAGEIQKQEAKNAYEANLAAIELQKKKVAEAYDSMKEEQKLLNTQRKVREETALGLIYGGFGSVAANKNIEETIIRGERELMSLSKDAVNKDTELQNEVVNLNKAYELDVRKIEQWKAEESGKVYAQLSSYVQDITADKNMAAVEKDAAIRDAITSYNTKVAEIATTVAETRKDLALEILNRADSIKQQEFNNQITLAQETREAESYEYEKQRIVINDARTDLDLVLTSYIGKDYSTLPADVLAQIKQLEEAAKLPSGAGQAILEAATAAQLKEGTITKEFTNSVTGEVTAISYNFDTGKVETMQLGALEGESQNQVWTEIGTDADGNIMTMNEVTGEIKTQGQYSGQSGTPADALSVPDDSIGGQCGHFVNQYTGLGMGDSFGSKVDALKKTGGYLTNFSQVQPGAVFVMQISGSDNGHTGFILSTYDSNGDGVDDMAKVKDSNWFKKSDELTGGGAGRVATHNIPIAQMAGFLNVSGGSSTTTTPSSTSGAAEDTTATTEEEPTVEEDSGYTPLFK